MDDHVFREHLSANTRNTTSSGNEFPNDKFFLDINDLFGNLNMGGNSQQPLRHI
jgi:hypothetical protein